MNGGRAFLFFDDDLLMLHSQTSVVARPALEPEVVFTAPPRRDFVAPERLSFTAPPRKDFE